MSSYVQTTEKVPKFREAGLSPKSLRPGYGGENHGAIHYIVPGSRPQP